MAINQFYNPLFLSKIIKSYLFYVDNLRRLNDEQLQKFRNKQFRKIIQLASTVPMYRKLYRENNVKFSDIKDINYIKKLPIISKETINKYYPNGIIPNSKKIDDLIKVSTSGTTGKSLAIYVDMYDIIMGLFGYLRTVKEYDINWRKHKISIIADFLPHTAETGYVKKGLIPKAWFQSILGNFQWLDTNDSPEKVIKELDSFQPDFIGGYTGMLGHLAVLRQNGIGENISPKYIASTGTLLDPSLKKFIEETFNTTMFEVYGATESGPIAFQCKKEKIYHVMSDLVFPEYIENGKHVSSKEPGHLVITKLYGGGTPIIRYDAINDVVSPLYEKHDCGMSGELIDKIYGRDSIRLYRKDGKILLATSLTNIFTRLLYELKTSKVRDIKVIQHDLENIEINLVIEEKLRNVGPSVDEIISYLDKGFKNIFGSGIKIIFKEVKKVGRTEPRIISNVDTKDLKIKGYA